MTPCLRCGYDPDPDPATLVVYRGRKQKIVGSYALAPCRQGKYHGKSITLVCVVAREECDHEILSPGESGQRVSPAAPLPAGHHPVPALSEDVPAAQEQAQVPVLPKAARKRAGAVKR